jgi:DNA polymerase delta subunit 1
MLTFQHICTSRHKGEGNGIDVMLYGRQADGVSTAIRVVGVRAYGYINTKVNEESIRKWVRWILVMQMTEGKCRRYENENDKQKMPNDEILKFFNKCWSFSEMTSNDIRWTCCSGYNIRHVKEYAPPTVWKFTVLRYDVWRALLSCFKNIDDVHKRITKFRNDMKSRYEYVKEQMNQKKGGRFNCSPISGMPCSLNMGNDIELYETMFQPEIVWMVDNQLPACSWMNVDKYTQVKKKTTSCTVEYKVAPTDVTPCEQPPIPMAPFRVLSYDIEAMPYVNPDNGECEFPDPTRDSITTIGVTSFNMVEMKMIQTVFMFEDKLEQGKCSKLPMLSADMQTDDYDPSVTVVKSYDNELEMLRSFAKFIQEYDPDIITGYNVLNFDNVYLIQRIEQLCPKHDGPYCAHCSSIRTFSRIKRPTTLTKKYTHTNQRGGQESWEAWIEGRDWMDLYRVVMNDHKLRSYKLDNVCSELLGTKKIHIDYEDIPKHQQTSDGRTFLAQYCVKDAWLPCQIIIKRCKLVNAIQMSQVTGVPLTSILHRGQQIRTLLLMLRQVKTRCRLNSSHHRWFLPDEFKKKKIIGGFEGAVVITPKPGYYQTPVVTLDFASLYPSIMRAYNMCFSTLIPSYAEAENLKLKWSKDTHLIKDVNHELYPEVRPVRSFDYPEGGKFEYKLKKTDVCFVTTKKRVGILPEILEQLLNERKRVKKLRKQYGEKSMDYAVLDGRQLALKVCANSVYGFTGAATGYLGEKRIASSVTRVGRGMANHTKFMCEDKYKEHGLQIVYGDTDSVFANIPPSMCDTNCSREELIQKVDAIGQEMGEFCTKAFLPPNDLEYEKFYYPILLKGKKRYAGHKFEPGLAPKLDVKGFECVRRDFAPIVSKCQKNVLVKLCKENDVQGAIEYARGVVIQLLENKIPLEELTMSKKLTRKPEDYKNPAPHTELAKRLQRTQPAHIAPKTGDRIDFVIRPGFKGEKTCMRAVTPEDVRCGLASPDNRWYLSNQLQKPLQRIFEMVMDNSSDIFEVTTLTQSQVAANSMMGNFVKRSVKVGGKRAGKIKHVPERKRVKKTNYMDIKSFFM